MVDPINILGFHLLQECFNLIEHFICVIYLLYFIYLWHQLTSLFHFSLHEKMFIHEVKSSFCVAIHISNTQHKFREIMDVHFSDDQPFLKNGQKSD